MESGERQTPSLLGSSCSHILWTAPRRLSVGSASPLARFPEIGAGTQEVFIVGNDLRTADPSALGKPGLTLSTISGAFIDPPPGDHMFAYAKALVHNDILHLVWGEPTEGGDPTDTSTWFRFSWGSLWTAAYDSRTGWTAPRALLEEPVHWSARAELVQSRDGVSDLVVVGTGTPGPVLWLGTFSGTSWDVRPLSIPAVENVSYASLARFGQRMALGFVAAIAEGRASDVNSVWAVYSMDSGTTWSSRALLYRSPTGGPAFDFRMRVDAAGDLHAVWVQTTPSQLALFYARSQDLGRTWTDAEEIDHSAGDVFNPQLLVHPCDGAVVVLYEKRMGSGNRIFQLTRVADAWTQPIDLFPGLRATDPAIAVLPDGGLLLAFLGQEAPDTDGSIVQTYVARTRSSP